MNEWGEVLPEANVLLNKNGRDSFWFSALFTECIIIALFVFLNAFVFSCVIVSGSSMYPTLENGDVLIMNRAKTPDYGDVVVIDKVKSVSKNGEVSYEWLIKRVIAKGGDTVDIKDGGVWLKKADEDEFYLLEENYVSDGNATVAEKHGGKNEITEYPYTVPEDEIFFLGDNRGSSMDSRYYGTCKEKDVVGVVSETAVKTKGFLTGINDASVKFRKFLRGYKK